jgi:hypothetical protein
MTHDGTYSNKTIQKKKLDSWDFGVNADQHYDD